MSNLNISTSHPLINNSQQYVYQKKYVSIQSQDRDILKYPVSSSFEIQLPQDYLNVQSVKLSDWSFPSNYYVFSKEQYNTIFVFSIIEPYDPYTNNNNDPLQQAIFSGLNNRINDPFTCSIQDGTYTPTQISTELTNKMNESVNEYLISYLSEYFPNLLQLYIDTGGYSDFVVIYNSVSIKLLFGNKNSGFKLNNSSSVYSNLKICKDDDCINRRSGKQYINWGLPWFLGFTYCDIESTSPINYIYDENNNVIQFFLPRIYYGDVKTGDDGYWLIPTLPGANVYYLEAPEKININIQNNIYMEIVGLNNIDTTSPFNISNFTKTTNETNGIVNSSFAKIYISPFSFEQDFKNIQYAHKYFNPPAERIRRLNISIKYHNGEPVLFGNNDFSFTLEFGILTPQNKLETHIDVPECVKYLN